MGDLKVTDPNDLLNSISDLIYKEVVKETSQMPGKKKVQNPYLKMARIDPDHTGSGRPKLIFPGDDVTSGKAYPYLGTYSPEANDYVLIAKVHGTWVILGKIK